MIKRVFDIVAASAGLLLLSPLLLVAAALVKLDSPGPVLFSQERVGRRFRLFRIYKLRTMVRGADVTGHAITCGEDPRITRVGRLLRRLKIDELPQLVNVVKGEMSLVGPRPELPHYVELFRADYQDILEVRPGITDVASINYRNESELLGRLANPEEEYLTRILPDKIRLEKLYLRKAGVGYDLKLIVSTLLTLLTRGRWPHLDEASSASDILRTR
ncbi:MAG: sugar transferase [Acidobacteria bacterium]|nr:sugar transferase [Acidobacteriota bacterium]